MNKSVLMKKSDMIPALAPGSPAVARRESRGCGPDYSLGSLMMLLSLLCGVLRLPESAL